MGNIARNMTIIIIYWAIMIIMISAPCVFVPFGWLRWKITIIIIFCFLAGGS